MLAGSDVRDGISFSNGTYIQKDGAGFFAQADGALDERHHHAVGSVRWDGE